MLGGFEVLFELGDTFVTRKEKERRRKKRRRKEKPLGVILEGGKRGK